MIIIPLSPAELLQAILTVILIYVTWITGQAGKNKNTKK